MIVANSIEDVQRALQQDPKLNFIGGGSKPALSAHANLSLSALTGILQYEPSEYTFTALAATRLREVADALVEHGQFMPFDPPMIDAGGTLGGTIAAGLSGSGRFRYGGIRDFLLGVKMITRGGRVVFGGSKVVKNAAGFDIPKLMTGSVGHLGAMIEVTFKVFPRPTKYATLCFEHDNLTNAVANLQTLAGMPFDLTCCDLVPSTNGNSEARIWLRFGGIPSAQTARSERIMQSINATGTKLDEHEESKYWNAVNEFADMSECSLIKIPIHPGQIVDAEALLAKIDPTLPRRYAVGGNVLWLGWPTGGSRTKLEGFLMQLERKGLAITGNWPSPFLGEPALSPFLKRIEATFVETLASTSIPSQPAATN